MLDLLPSKHVRLHETLLGLGAVILTQLGESQEFEQVWEGVKDLKRRKRVVPEHTTIEDVVLTVDFLYALGAVTMNAKGELSRCA